MHHASLTPNPLFERRDGEIDTPLFDCWTEQLIHSPRFTRYNPVVCMQRLTHENLSATAVAMLLYPWQHR